MVYSPLRELQISHVTKCLHVKVTSHILTHTHTSPERVTENDQGSAKTTIPAHSRPIKLNPQQEGEAGTKRRCHRHSLTAQGRPAAAVCSAKQEVTRMTNHRTKVSA